MGKLTTKLINKMLVGEVKSEEVARSGLPSNRWELFWDIFKNAFWKLVVVNLLIILFCVPLALLIYYRSVLEANYATIYPFSQGFGVGYQAPINMLGFSESITYTVNVLSFLFLPLAMIFAALGLSGGAYVMRNIVWTEGVFVSNDFWKGIKGNYKQIVVICLLYSLVFYITMLTASYSRCYIVVNAEATWVYHVCEILSYFILAYYTLMTLYMISMAVTYELSIGKIIKNSLYIAFAFLPHGILFVMAMSVPVVLLFISQSAPMVLALGLLVMLFIGVSYMLLVWTNYSQWCFDNYINDRVPGAKKNRGIYEKVKSQASEIEKQKYKTLKRNTLNSRPIKPITDEEIKIVELPQSFNREDLLRLKQSKAEMVEDHEKYVEEHKNDERYLPTEEEKEIQKQEQERLKKLQQAKKALQKYDKRK